MLDSWREDQYQRLKAERHSTPVWDAVHLRTMGTRLRTEAAERFDAAAAGRGLTRYEAIRRLCIAVIRNPAILDGLDWR